MMQLGSFLVEANKLEVYNTLFGIEKVMLNDKVVSSKWSLFGTKHKLNIESAIFTVKTQFSYIHRKRNTLTLLNEESKVKEQKIDNATFWMKQFFIGLITGLLASFVFNLLKQGGV